ncbi:MAG: hypothetical protein JSW26_04225 [Desulfobacterales bacterium]|nr:MAG: hypothetical protein JSW26_04225 [Desulfobacterales bacterium]
MRINLSLKYILTLLVLMCQGCATYATYQRSAAFERPPEYIRFINLLDQAVKETGVRNAADFPVGGFPYLRTNRFLTALKDHLDSDERKEQWVRRLQQLDLDARRKEIQNLPADDLTDLAHQLGEPADRKILFDRLAFYSEQLLTGDQRRPDFSTILQAAVTSPSEYSTAMRVVGIYPLTCIPVAAVTRNVQDKFTKRLRVPVDQLETLGELTAYGPLRSEPYSERSVRLILDRSRQNPLEIPQLSDADQKLLLAMFAPVVYQDIAAAYDKIGEVVWHDNKVGINPDRPTVYYYSSHALLKGKPILQLNYVFWYSARNGPLAPWIERGPLDGLTVRVSLDNDGRPFMVDIMNNCGCYHFFLPSRQKIAKLIPLPDELDAFVPRRLPASYPQERLRLRMMSGWHQVAHIDSTATAAALVPYELAPYERLEMLPRQDRTYESIFNSNGIGKNSGRIEPLIFFPMGIPDIGSMRQRGHHAVKFIGREHFDDPDLFDKNFEFK